MKSDIQIREDVLEEIRWDPQLKKIAPQIGVFVKDEVVTLSGMVDYYFQRIAAENAAQRIAGVKVVAVDIDVRGVEAPDTVTDSEIAAAIRNALKWHSGVNEDQINIKVDNGWVYLDGAVHWNYERKAAELAIESLKGIKGIINRVKIRTVGAEPGDIKRKINAAFHRSAAIDAANITVTVNADEVELTGRVRSSAERKQAEEVVLCTPGVTKVNNRLEVATEILAS